MDIDLDQARRRAKELLRAARAGEAELRADRAPRLADAQRAVANELGFRSWPALVDHVTGGGPETTVRDTGLEYARGRPVRVRVRRRGIRYDIDDLGGALEAAQRPPGWREAAERTVAEEGLNVTRAGEVCVQIVEGRDVDAIVRKLARTSLAVYDAVLDLDT
jgi:hypothetical protein